MQKHLFCVSIPYLDELEEQAKKAERDADLLLSEANELEELAGTLKKKAESLKKLAQGYRRAAEVIRESVKDVPEDILKERAESLMAQAQRLTERAEKKKKVEAKAEKIPFIMNGVTYAEFLVNSEAGSLRADFRYPITEETEVFQIIIKQLLPVYKEKGASYTAERDSSSTITAIVAENLEAYMVTELLRKLQGAVSSDVKAGKAAVPQRVKDSP
ncbi:hypothetical protein B9Q03_09670 [Candidatus Marsarchaeota G2 archaeon OSP_D]|nr:MAG: hypothetical protein B9Q02_11805 [Candidatus Marsarchaeota G1 archaeon BE_D]PSN88070.1 MAG: hypothetical protein B9Q03_09670 [Candidatus Marsarchaeota G2 archaeon OSP_D]